MKKRILSLVLCAAMLLSMCLFLGAGVAEDTTADGSAETTESYIPAVNFTNVAPFVQANAQAANGPARAPLRAANVNGDSGSADKGVVTSKTATANDDDTYTITLEAYATGSKVITEIQKDVPTDIVLVLDQSGSMNDPFSRTTEDSWVSYGKQINSENYDTGNLYYKLADGSYVEVSVDRTSGAVQDYVVWPNASNRDCYRSYYTLCTNTEEGYKEVTVTRSGRSGNKRNYTYVYTLNNGTTVTKTSTGDNGNPPYTIYRVRDTYEYTYEYYYTVNGVRTSIGEQSKGADTVFDVEFYKKVPAGTSITALEALQNAVRNFAGAVENKAAGKDGELGTADDINHRIAVVGYASRADSNNPWINTELFIGANQHNYNVDAKNYYNQAFQDMNTHEGQANIQASIGALDADGATYTDYGMEMANGILDAYPLTNNEQRNRVIILFTDGFPGRNTDNFNTTAADTAISHAKTAKDNGTTVYTVGIFSGANATSAGDVNGNNTQKANWFMQRVSSNNGTPQSPSYYLSAADADTLKNIFKQISDQIESGGSSSTLTGEAVVKDIISPQFQLPEGTTADDIKLETYACTGKTGDTYTWSKNDDAMGATATVEDGTVSVTGFDFAKNYVGTVTENGKVTYRGDKLVISFNVKPKDDFLGGNDVFTNDGAYIYDKSTATEPVCTFDDKPQVNVPIKDVTVTATDKNVYLLGNLTANQLRSGATVKVGDVSLDLSKENYGLDDWQTAYVNIGVTITDKDGNDVSTDGLSSLTGDTTYTVTVKVTPKTEATETTKKGAPATEQSDSKSANVNVYKPVLTYKDSEGYYGDTAPDFDSNLPNTVWKHGDTVANTILMGEAPELTITCMPDDGAVVDGKINTRTDFGVDVTVKIDNAEVTEETVFHHEDCAGKTCEPPAGKEFLVHVNTCSLKITKTVKGDGANPDQTFVFNVKKDNDLVTTVVLKAGQSTTITGLAVGDYTVVEDTNWSWSYKVAENSEKVDVKLSSTKPNGEAKITNTAKENHWLTSIVDVINKWTDKNNIDNTRQVPGPGAN